MGAGSKQPARCLPPESDVPDVFQSPNKMNRKVDEYLRSSKWQDELGQLRKISLACGLTEELKWGKPCYTFQNSNIVILQGFKDFCALLFTKGALLKDPKGVLKTFGWQAARRIPFTDVREIVEMETILKAYINEAIEAAKAGLKVTYKKNAEPIPEELQNKLDDLPALKAAFEALTPGRQRGYILYFSAPKQSKTRESRVDKCMRQILKGKGLNDH
ncbi:MAG TPA: YdeI/OmpD-associated family protein [Chthoniobacterales bacterium]|nr:YdeI/OmpD-associated family protein [Chthoniobacterales bacterium]